MKIRFEFYSSKVPVGNDKYPDKFYQYSTLTRAIQGMCRRIEAYENKGCRVEMCRAYVVGYDVPFEIIYPHSFETWYSFGSEHDINSVQSRGEQE